MRRKSRSAQVDDVIAGFEKDATALLAKYRKDLVESKRNRDRPKRPRRSPDVLEDQALRVAVAVSEHPEGAMARQIAREIGLPRASLAVPLRQSVQLGLVQMRGQRRGVRYFAQ